MTSVARERPELQVSEGVSTFFLLAVLLFSVTGSIDAAKWTEGLGLLSAAALGGLVLGFALARLPLRSIYAHALMLILAFPAVVALATILLPNVLTFNEKLIVLQERTRVWFTNVVAGKEGSDSLIFVVQLTFVMWIISYVSTWYVYRRHQVWGAILPPGFALLINLFYAVPQSTLYLVLFLMSALLLLVRLNLRSLEEWWGHAAIGYASDISFDFLLYGAVFAVLLMTVAWLVPASPPGPSWFSFLEPLQEPWHGVEAQFTRVFNTLNAVARPDSNAFIGTTLAIGGPVQLGQRPVMDVQSEAGRYWRATVYDKYTGIGWISTHLDSVNLSANDPRLDNSRELMRVQVTQTVKIFLPDQNILYAAAQPVRFDLPTEVRFGRPPQSAATDLFDLTLARSRSPLREGATYHVASMLSVADEDSLRSASIQPSEWISATYLQLPDNLPARVRSLAQSITEPYSNPYDQAAAIEAYLRTKIKYNDQVSAPPPGRDGVDYVLFDRPEGYCNYYASAMAVLLRSIGIPARVAAGYTLGDYRDGVFHVVEANAHSWPEVYFAGYGWIEFEPTANKPEINRPKKPDVPPLPSSLDDAAAQERLKRARQKDLEDDTQDAGSASFLPFEGMFFVNPGALALASGSLIVLLIVGVLVIRQWRHSRRMARLAPAAHVYENLLNRARWLGVREQRHATPFERAQTIGNALPEARRQVESVAAMYAREKFGARTMDPVDRAALTIAWSKFGAVWRRAFVAQTIERIVTPPRNFMRGVRARIAHWGGHAS
ncbi:MAG TPA: transglutaminaseTgpA domain-containing protein [Anaerolineae bacterium]